MPDMLVRLYDLPSSDEYYRRAEAAGVTVRRAEPWDRLRLRTFIDKEFGPWWSVEAELAFARQPISAFLATKERSVVGFAAYECTRRGYFGPTGLREDLRGNGIGAALLFSCLESMWEMGYAYAVIGGVGPAAFYEKVCGAFLIPGSEIGVYGTLLG
jgi:predicted N-acetyltransferase YhbS